MNFLLVLLTGFTASLLSDVLWYEVGRRRGGSVLRLLCRVSLEPDYCVRRTEEMFARHGVRSLLVAKFVPGLSTAAPPLAGVFGMRPLRFLRFDGLGALLWIGAYAGAGYLLSGQLERVAAQAERLGAGLLLLLAGSLAGYITWKYAQRRRFLRQLRVARISAEDLKRKLDAGEELVVVDLRHSLDFEAAPYTIPGAIRMDGDKLADHPGQIPLDRDVVLYCT